MRAAASLVLIAVAVVLAACSRYEPSADGVTVESPAPAPAPTDAVTSKPAVIDTPSIPDVEMPVVDLPAPKLDINTASHAALEAVPGATHRMVHEFEEYRPYVSIEQFRREMAKYIDAAKIAEYEKYLYVPVDIDECDAATLQQLPGVDADIAAALIAARPFGSNAAFLEALAAHVDGQDVAQAKAYLKSE